MSVWHLILREILHRRLSFALGVLAVAVAVGALVGQVVLLEQHDLRTETLLQVKEVETKARGDKLKDDIRVTTKNLGFNVQILHKDLKLVDFYDRDFADQFLPEEYAQRLARSKIVTINHLSPSLVQRVPWPEQERSVLVIGTGGEMPILSQDKKKPIQEPVPCGKVILGHQLYQLVSKRAGKDLAVGAPVLFNGKTYQIHKLQPAKDPRDDITLLMHLKDAQELLGKEGYITGMLALGCNCSAERMSVIRQEIADILPDARVEEYQTKAIARAEARTQVEAEGQAAVEAEVKHRDAMRAEKETFGAIVVALVVFGCGAWLGLMAWLNVLERETEIGLYRALGLRSTQLFTLFLARALLVGLAGALCGCLAGIVTGWFFSEAAGEWTTSIAQPGLYAGVLAAAPLTAALACWIPALLAVRRDPAVILQKE